METVWSVQLILPSRELNAELVVESHQIYTAEIEGPLTPESELLSDEIDPASGDEDYVKPFYATDLLNLIQYHQQVTFAHPKRLA